MTQKLLNVDQMAEVLDVQPSWLYARTRKGTNIEVPHIKLGKYVRFDKEKVLEFYGVDKTADPQAG